MLCSVSTVLCMSIPPCRRRRLVKVMHGRPRARPGAPYQCLPTPQTKPKTMWSCMWNPLPNLTKIRARGANQLGVFGLVRGPLTRCYQSTVLAVDQYKIVLPIITGRGVKYTHNDHEHRILHPDSGPLGIRLIPPASNPKAIARPHPHDPQGWHGPGPVVSPPRPRRTATTAQLCCAKQVNLVKNS